jgi:hypothetical protein
VEGVRLVIIHVATAHMLARTFYAKGQPNGFSPGYDEDVGQPLYSVRAIEGPQQSPGDLYHFEVTRAR